MYEQQIVPPPARRIIWTQPMIQIINVNAARHGGDSPLSDAGKNHKS